LDIGRKNRRDNVAAKKGLAVFAFLTTSHFPSAPQSLAIWGNSVGPGLYRPGPFGRHGENGDGSPFYFRHPMAVIGGRGPTKRWSQSLRGTGLDSGGDVRVYDVGGWVQFIRGK